MEAGRELDALVAEKVFGKESPKWYTIVGDNEYDYGGISSCSPGEGTLGWIGPQQVFWPNQPSKGIHACSHYSTDIAAAWEVVEKASGEGPHKWSITNEHDTWYVSANGVAEAEADTAPHAICLAALKAKEV